MTALRLNHVSVSADDLDVSERFYTELFGMVRIPAPDFEVPVRWLQVGATQLHLFKRAVPAPSNHHFALTVDDFAAVYATARALDALDRPVVRRLPGGEAQAYLRDPAGNLVEINAANADALDKTIVGELVPVGGDDSARLSL